ncbi:MAG: lamin tail domain-containing protein, partial [Planctomycetota bacterium]
MTGVPRSLRSTLLGALCALGAALPAQASDVNISQIYTRGGVAAGSPNADYVELYNSTATAIPIGGWTITYTSATGTFGASQFTFPSGAVIAPYGYVSVSLNVTATGTAVATDFLAATAIDLDANSGNIALLTAAQSGTTNSCASLNATLVDKVAYGTGNCAEGTATTANTNTQAMFRKNAGATDTDNNASDFELLTPGVRTSVFARWDFNAVSTNASTGTGTSAELGVSTAAFSDGLGSATDPATGTADDARSISGFPAGDGAGGIVFSASTVGRDLVVVSWDQYSDSRSSKYARFEYSTNGTTFTTAGLANGGVFTATTGNAWSGMRVVNLAGIAGVDNNPNFRFRIVAIFETTATGSGTAGFVPISGSYANTREWQFDWVSVSGAADSDGDGDPDFRDCNDSSAAVYTGAPELCSTSSVDNDCDGDATEIDAAASDKVLFYTDADGDAFTLSTGANFCPGTTNAGYRATQSAQVDCNDGSA